MKQRWKILLAFLVFILATNLEGIAQIDLQGLIGKLKLERDNLQQQVSEIEKEIVFLEKAKPIANKPTWIPFRGDNYQVTTCECFSSQSNEAFIVGEVCNETSSEMASIGLTLMLYGEDKEVVAIQSKEILEALGPKESCFFVFCDINLEHILSYKVLADTTKPAVSNQKVIEKEERDFEAEIKAYAKRKWPDEYEMQLYEYNKQMEALRQIQNLPSTPDYNESILLKAMSKWGEEYDMVMYEYNKQLEAYKEMQR
jgi:hypothetical protein